MYYFLNFLLLLPVLVLMVILIYKIPLVKVWHQDIIDANRMQSKIQKTEWERDQLVSLVQDQENSLKDSSKVLTLISQTKKEIESGALDDSLAG